MSEGVVAAPDAEARARIVAERDRNVCIIAGAGTGKTTAIVRRMVGMLAPEEDGSKAVSIDRLVAITFTRRAAGDLRFRMRQMLLAELGRPDLSRVRKGRLGAALSGLDVAFVGTIHAFADRLLRRRPAEARLSPAYSLTEDIQPLVAETLRRLLRAVERDGLREALGAWGAGLSDEVLEEGSATIRAAQRAGLAMERRPTSWGELPSLEGLIHRFVETRDVTPEPADPPPVEQEALRRVGSQLQRAIDNLPEGPETPGRRWLRQVAERLGAAEDEPSGAVGLVQEIFGRRLQKARHFKDEGPAFALYKRVTDTRGVWHRQLVGPHRWLGVHLVRLSPVVVAFYEQVRSESQAVDFLEILLRLRDLLRDRPDVRLEFQSLFDHILVDEFQDTDPLQCEIVFYLCEDGAKATSWSEIELGQGRLTLVGDPQQSIYRFRRADISTVRDAMTRVRDGGALLERLTTNFRSRPSLVSWFNDALPAVLGKPPAPGAPNRDGRVPYQPMDPSPEIPEFDPVRSVLVLNYVGASQEALKPWTGRVVEARGLALLLQNLVRPDSKMRIRDEETGQPRPIRPADVAVLTESMTDVPKLLGALADLGLRATVRGGRLLLEHPLIREMLLGYCALCDDRDGVAEAALMRPPFFPLSETAGLDPDDMAWQIAIETVHSIRGQRAEQTPGALVRDLIERTGLNQALLLEVGGPELQAACYDVALELDRRAAAHQLDAGAAAQLARAWATAPIPLIAPEPTGHDAIRVLTVYQAKGLEFPVVVLWDGFRELEYRYEPDWLVSRDGKRWSMRLGDVVFEHPENGHLLRDERQIRSRERERLAYVATTRARDLLVLPVPERDWSRGRDRNRILADAADAPRLPFVDGENPGWHRAGPPARLPEPIPDEELEMTLTAQALHTGAALSGAEESPSVYAISEAAAAVAREVSPESAWASVRQLDLGDDEGIEEGEEDLFSAAVHAALDLLLTGRAADAADASQRSARAYEIPHLKFNIATHVQRTQVALISNGLHPDADVVRCAVPVTLVEQRDLGHTHVLTGTLDLMLRRGRDLWLIELRTDPPPSRSDRLARAYPEILVEMDMIVRALDAAGALGGLEVHRGALFTRTGDLIDF